MTVEPSDEEPRKGWWCSRTTKAGRPCKGNIVGWWKSEMPDPRSCVGHLSEIERAEHKRILERAEAETAWLWEAGAAFFASDPACWSWPPPNRDDIDRLKASFSSAVQNRLTADDWPVLMMSAWQNSRCAICGRRAALVTDHDHRTALVRGYLCSSCNTREGFRAGGIWDKYRKRNPASICGVRERYWDPFERRFAGPLPEFDKWKDNPMKGIGL